MKHSILQCCLNGYHFCERCSRVVDGVPEDAENPACPHCKKHTVKWMPPAILPKIPIDKNRTIVKS
jgi:hypothetical protein